MNTDLTDLADAMRVERYDKNRIKTPCGATLMLRVIDVICLGSSYVNEFPTPCRDNFHQVSGDTLPHMAINHAFGKNSYAGCWTINNRPLCRWEAHIG